jgi:hypothetical protein
MNYAVRYKATAGTTTIGKQDVTVEYASTVEGKPVLSMAFPSGLLGSMRTGAISCGPVADSELANYNVRITQSRQADWNGLETLDFTSGVISAAVRCDLPKAPFDLNAQLTFAIDLGWVSATSKANHLAKATNPTAITGASADDLCLGYLTSGNTFSCVPGATGSTGVPELNYETDQSTDWDIMKDVVTYETKKLGDGVTTEGIVLAVIFKPSAAYHAVVNNFVPTVAGGSSDGSNFPWWIILILLLVILLLGALVAYLWRYKRLFFKSVDILKQYDLDNADRDGAGFDGSEPTMEGSSIAELALDDVIIGGGGGGETAGSAANAEQLADMKAEVARLKKAKEASAEQTSAAAAASTRKGHRHRAKRKKQGFGQTKLDEETADGPAELPPLPDGWAERVDPTTKKTYYYKNDGSGQTSWDRPTA